MRLISFSSTSSSLSEVLEDITKSIKTPPDLMIVYMTVGMPMAEILEELALRFVKTKIAGSTSCNGAMTEKGFHSENNQGLGGIAFYSNSSDYGIGFSLLQDGKINVPQACEVASASAKKRTIRPSLIWMISSPGIEEYCIEELKKYFGAFVPVFGGTAADNDISGKWQLFYEGRLHQAGLIVISFFDIPEPHFSFHCGYQVTEFKGKVTKAEGRKLVEIDSRPSAIVYDEWTGGLINRELGHSGAKSSKNILRSSSLKPLARQRGEVGSYPYFLLSHPETVTPENGLSLFTDIHEGEEIILMEGSIESLQNRASEVAKGILERERMKEEDIAGALVVFCAGCMLTVSSISSMQPVVDGLKSAFGVSVPFLGVFSYGEQGCFFEEGNFHGNLMISVTVFLKEHK